MEKVSQLGKRQERAELGGSQLSAMCKRGTSLTAYSSDSPQHFEYVRVLLLILALYDVGDMPYRVAAPLLQQCKAEQLRMIEDVSPHLLEHTEELWQRACLRDFSDLRKLHEDDALVPPDSWRDLYSVRSTH